MKIAAALATLTALFATSAMAADMAVKAPPPAPLPAATWTGCYAGGNIGAGWQRNDPVDPTDPVDLGTTVAGFIGGGQVGCDYQWSSNLVVGIQGMFDGSDVAGSHILPFAYSGDSSEKMTFRTDWIGTLTGRLGYTVLPQALLYFKAGAAWTHTKYTDEDPSGVLLPPYVGQVSAIREGWIVGAGLEYAFRPNWSAFLEYDFIGLGSPYLAFNYNCGAACGFSNPYFYKETQNLQSVLLGVNYRFGR